MTPEEQQSSQFLDKRAILAIMRASMDETDRPGRHAQRYSALPRMWALRCQCARSWTTSIPAQIHGYRALKRRAAPSGLFAVRLKRSCVLLRALVFSVYRGYAWHAIL